MEEDEKYKWIQVVNALLLSLKECVNIKCELFDVQHSVSVTMSGIVYCEN